MLRPKILARHALVGIPLLILGCAAIGSGFAGQRANAQDVGEIPDVSPLPSDDGDFVSVSPDGDWKRRPPTQALDVSGAEPEPSADCSRKAIIYYATRAPDAFVKEHSGLLYGVETHTPATAVGGMPGYNSCALVVHAVLKRAGCKWSRWTADARAVYDMAYDRGWRPATSQSGGCIVAWNSRKPGGRPRIGRAEHRDKKRATGVLFRHVGITTGGWWSIDNTSFLNRPSGGFTYRPFRYESPMFLCPPEKSKP